MIVVFGATGYTGRLVARHLTKRGAGPMALAGRDRAKLERLKADLGRDAAIRVADVRDPASVAAAVRGARVVISCAGPFTDLGRPVVDAVLKERCHYLDTTGEHAFVKWVYGRDEEARRAGVALVPACAFEIAVSDCAAAIAAAGLDPVDSVEVGYRVGSAATRGTTKSIFRAAEEGAEAIEDGRPVRVGFGGRRRSFELGQAFEIPGADPAAIARHVKARRIHAYMRAPAAIGWFFRTHALVHRIPVVGRVQSWATQRLLDLVLPEGPSEERRAASPFTVIAEASGRETRAIRVDGKDAYEITGAIAAEAALRMERETFAASGALAPSQAVGPATAFLDALKSEGVKWGEARPMQAATR